MSANSRNRKIVSMQDYCSAAQLSESDEFIRYVVEGDADAFDDVSNEGEFIGQNDVVGGREAASDLGSCQQVISEINELKSQLSELSEMVSALGDAVMALHKPVSTKRRHTASSAIFSVHEDEALIREIAALYAKHLPHLSQPRESSWMSSSSNLHKALKARIKELLKDKEYRCQSPKDVADWFGALFIRVGKSDFLSGRKTDFKANIHWLLKPLNLQKILDGSYDNNQSGTSLTGVYAPAANVAVESQTQAQDPRLQELERMQLPDEVKDFVKMQIDIGDSSPLPQLISFAQEVVNHD